MKIQMVFAQLTGFGDAVEDQWYNVKMPFYLDIYLGKRNHTKDEAYQSRLIIKVRWVVQRIKAVEITK